MFDIREEIPSELRQAIPSACGRDVQQRKDRVVGPRNGGAGRTKKVDVLQYGHGRQGQLVNWQSIIMSFVFITREPPSLCIPIRPQSTFFPALPTEHPQTMVPFHPSTLQRSSLYPSYISVAGHIRLSLVCTHPNAYSVYTYASTQPTSPQPPFSSMHSSS